MLTCKLGKLAGPRKFLTLETQTLAETESESDFMQNNNIVCIHVVMHINIIVQTPYTINFYQVFFYNWIY